ncbi:hypothetical protein TNCV_2200411 [Trichonephila clavipes]|nr:hypothetical protein TNCV_2200411 [Trichonephila clavipes]
MNDKPNANECKFNYIGPCSSTHLFIPEKYLPETYWIDSYKEPFASIIFRYKSALQMLQLTILENDEQKNMVEIGNCFKELEKQFEKIVHDFRKA